MDDEREQLRMESQRRFDRLHAVIKERYLRFDNPVFNAGIDAYITGRLTLVEALVSLTAHQYDHLNSLMRLVQNIAATEQHRIIIVSRSDGPPSDDRPVIKRALELSGSLRWLGNNLQNYNTPLFEKMLRGVVTEADAVYPHLEELLGRTHGS